MATATPHKRQEYNLGPVTGIPMGEGRVFQIGPLAVAVFRTRREGVFATQAWCPHKAGPLADGLIGTGQVICPLHGYTFDLATGQPVGNACKALDTYTVFVSEAGDILLRLDGV
jgi:nitrite reductase (NADH) small subunit